MKSLFISYLLINMITSFAFSQSKSDTNFIVREYDSNEYHAIFIDTNRNSSFYINLENHTNSPFDSSFYFEQLGLLKKNNANGIKHTMFNFASDWTPLYMYKGRYYVYFPSDGMYNNWINISDSIFLFYAGGEMISNTIDNFKKVSAKTFQFDLSNAKGKQKEINIYIVDEKKDVAVFEYADKKGIDKYELKVATKKIRNFPIIVNYCNTQKVDELEFEKPDFKKLLNE